MAEPITPPEPNPNPPAPVAVIPAVPVLKPAGDPSPVKPDVPTLTLDQVKELLASERATWESEHLPKLKEQVTEAVRAPIQAETLIAGFREEMKLAGLYLPKDDDNSDPDNPGDIAALDPADHSVVLRTNKDGTKFTKFQRDLNRLRSRMKAERKPARTGEMLGTPPNDPAGGTNEYDRIREDAKARAEAERNRTSRPLPSMIG